jgi:formamidopyrimidine-DNA glycosylase
LLKNAKIRESMPELPEVETIKRQLQKTIVGKKIKTVDVLLPKIIKTPLAQFKKAAKGAKIKKIERRAKILIFTLDNNLSFLVHLKLTGQLIFQETRDKKQETSRSKHTHVIFNFSDNSRLTFNDLRQFGYIKLVKSADLGQFFLNEKIGPEPLDKDFTLVDLQALLEKKPKSKIKQFLMDQKNIAGIGNIYADEILFFANTHPLRQIKTLKPKEIARIFKGIKTILPQAIKYKGTSAENYLDAFGKKGHFLKKLKVYGKEGQNCVKCKQAIKKVKIGGRSAHFCLQCQQ